jgi:hypothetical protein
MLSQRKVHMDKTECKYLEDRLTAEGTIRDREVLARRFSGGVADAVTVSPSAIRN